MKTVYLLALATFLTTVLLLSSCAKPSPQALQSKQMTQPQTGEQQKAANAPAGDLIQSPQAALNPDGTNASSPANNEWLLDFLPRCDGVNTLPQPVNFPWPSFQTRKRQLKGSNWGYFTCAQAPAVVSRLYRERLPNPPFLMKEIQWVSRREGTLGIFHSGASDAWIYVWVVPQPGNAQSALVVVANNYGASASFSCRVRGPSIELIDAKRTTA